MRLTAALVFVGSRTCDFRLVPPSVTPYSTDQSRASAGSSSREKDGEFR
jgi:hypothetical protein